MTILYLVDQDLDNESGVSHKISMQASQWDKMGHKVTILSLQSLSFYSLDGKRLSDPKVTIQRRRYKIFLHLIYSSWKLAEVIKDVDFDLVYMRYRLFAPLFKSALRNKPQVVEINSDDTQEYKLSSKLLNGYNKALRTRFLQDVDAFVCVSHELADLFQQFQKPICSETEC